MIQEESAIACEQQASGQWSPTGVGFGKPLSVGMSVEDDGDSGGVFGTGLHEPR